MSGFEIAGIVLGVIPLVISALENYQAGKGIAASIIKWKGLLQDLFFKLKLQRKMFYLDILELARSAQVSGLSGIIDPTEEQCVNILRNVDDDKEIRKYFGSLHETFIDILRRYETCLKTIVGKLEHIHRRAGTAKDDLAALIDANPAKDGRFEFRKRINFAISRRSLSDLVDQLRDDRLSLKMVVQGVKRQQEWIVKQASADAIQLAEYFSRTRRNAASLYMAIHQGYSCNCPDHRIFLRLQNRLPLHRVKGPRSGETGYFDLIFDAEGQLQDAIIESPPSNTSDSAPSQSTHTATVSFNLPAIQVTAQGGSPQRDPRKRVTNLCLETNEASSSGMLLSLQVVRDDDQLRLAGAAIQRRKSYSAQKSLGAFLQDTSQDEDARMTPKQQTILALDVAASILQLRETFWCQLPFDSSAIQLFFHSPVNTPTPASEPFVGQVIERKPAAHATLQGPSPRGALLELAILLLEIWHHKTFETWAAKAGLSDLVSIDGRMIAAMKWLRMTYERLPPHHLTAVEQCLALSSCRPWCWEDGEFRRLFCENVVKPLEESCKAW
ncbi:hypothetical protein F5Y10DRAFT_286767 [Nemania abortiva]|nr:hypothetical protein F5Y10DRAFT_286767 [Nemania abortiva]